MRNFSLVALALLLGTLSAFSPDALASRAPFTKETTNRFNGLEQEERLLKVPYTFTAALAISGATLSLGEAIPADSIITDVFSYVDTDVVSASANTISIGCATDTDLATANDFSDDAVNAVVGGAVVIQTKTSYVYTSAGCTPFLKVGTGTTGITAGRMMFFIKFIGVEQILSNRLHEFYP